MAYPERRIVGQAGWQFELHKEISSTNDLARSLPAWSAVRAQRQTAGRGRFGRSFVSDNGGFWISAVVPAIGNPVAWSGFSLMTGCRLLSLLDRLGVSGSRLRWPNDLMVARKKLGGILIEQAHGTLIVGLGINVHNSPWKQAPELATTTTRLHDVLPSPCGPEDLDAPVLDAISDAHAAMLEGGLTQAIHEFNARWSEARLVEITLLDGSLLRGEFAGLDGNGHLRVGAIIVPHNEVGRLREL